MSTFNKAASEGNTTLNHEGAVSYALPVKLELYSVVATTMMSGDKFYESKGDTLTRICDLVREVARTDPQFVAKLAIYARTDMHLRSVPLVLLVELDKFLAGQPRTFLARATARAIQRPDEMTELLAYFAVSHKHKGTKQLFKLSKALKKGLAMAFPKFDEHQLQKYNRATTIKLRDVLFISHPKPRDANQDAMWKRLINNDLATPETWETKLSEGADKKLSWEEIIDARNMGHMAIVRNLRNILEAEVSPAHIKLVINRLTKKALVLKSHLFPFRFYAAARELESVTSMYTSQVLQALNVAMQHAASNIKGFSATDRIHISVDTSGSMSSALSDRSKMKLQDVGLVMAMLLQEVSPAVEVSIFGDTLKHVNLTKGNILGNTDKLAKYSDMVGSSTNGYLVPRDLLTRKVVVDRLVVFTDCQLYDANYWGSSQVNSFKMLWLKYRKEINPNAKLYIFDLAGYGTTPISVNTDGVHLISGWSEKVFDVIEAYENGSSAVKMIEEVVI